MKVNEVMADLRRKFPNAPLEGWERDYRDALGAHEGARLGAAWERTLRTWTDFGAPKPGHILANLPEREKEKTYVEQLAERDLQRLARVRDRTNTLYETALRECSTYLDGPWSNIARYHLLNAARRVAELEERGHPLAAALANVSGSERRPACGECLRTRTWNENESRVCPPRAPDAWMDAHDEWIFKARMESQAKVNPKAAGGKRGESDPPWTRKAVTNAVIEAGMSEEKRLAAEQHAKRRAEINARIRVAS